MKTEVEQKDALGNNIILGEVYGYSVDSNGITTSTIGMAVHATPTGRIGLQVCSKRKGLWMDEAEEISAPDSMVSVKSMKLFPVSLDNLNKRK